MWQPSIELALQARSVAVSGTDAHFESLALLTRAYYELWRPDELEEAARTALHSVAALRRAQPDARESALGPINLFTATRIYSTELLLAQLLQSRAAHEDALGHLRAILEGTKIGPLDNADGLKIQAGLHAAWSLRSLGREQEMRQALESLRDHFGGTRESAIAGVVLEQTKDGIGAYRGKYNGDLQHINRMKGVHSALPAARKRVADALGLEVDRVPEVLVGVADAVPGMLGVTASTQGSPRSPEFPPVIVFFSEGLALDFESPEDILTHELVHAVLIVRAGLRYEAMPNWLTEGISYALAGQLESITEQVFEQSFELDRTAFFEPGYFTRNPPLFDSAPCASAYPPQAPLAFLYLEQKWGADAPRRFARALVDGQTMEECFQTITEMSAGDWLSQARPFVAALLETKRAEATPLLRKLSEAAQRGPVFALTSAEEVLAHAAPAIATNLALMQRARALELCGRNKEAAIAYAALANDRREHLRCTEQALLGLGRTFAAIGESGQAELTLRDLARDALSDYIRTNATSLLAEVSAQKNSQAKKNPEAKR